MGQLSKMGMENRRRFYFVRGEDGDNVLLHECELVCLGEYLAVGDRISYAVGPSRFTANYAHYRLECTQSRARRDQIRPMHLLSAPRWYSWASSWLTTNITRASNN